MRHVRLDRTDIHGDWTVAAIAGDVAERNPLTFFFVVFFLVLVVFCLFLVFFALTGADGAAVIVKYQRGLGGDRSSRNAVPMVDVSLLRALVNFE